MDNLFEILDPFEFEINKQSAANAINRHIKEIAVISANYFPEDHKDTEGIHLRVIDAFVRSLSPISKHNKIDFNNYRDNWLLQNFINPDGTIKDIKIEEWEK